MPKGRKILFAALAATLWPAAATVLPATPAAALPPYGSCQYDYLSRGWYRNYVTHAEPCTPTASEYYGTCIYDEWSEAWVRHYVTHDEPCDPV